MLTLYEPRLGDLWFRQMMMAEEETMAYNHAWGGTIAWPEEQWRDWHDRWIAKPVGQRFYRYLKNEDDQFVGEIAWHFDAACQHEMADVIIYAPYRGRGYGAEALELLCSEAKKRGVAVLWDELAVDNPAIGLFLRHGFTEERRTDESILLRREL